MASTSPAQSLASPTNRRLPAWGTMTFTPASSAGSSRDSAPCAAFTVVTANSVPTWLRMGMPRAAQRA